MQVAQQSKEVTHAILGGEETIDFGISSDPAFFHILSSTLYSNQKLAVVRETICNAWDAHIEAEESKPISIELSSTELVIRDYGHGIPHDMIGPIYGIYGGSTKKNDGKQTGGFGLGCKAPFSYTDTFTVTSWNQGTKTVYVMSKSSGEVLGKPSITPVANTPTDKTGLGVRIPILAGDRRLLQQYIEDVVYFGGITATLNDVALDTIKYDTPFGFVLHSGDIKYSSYQKTILIKYGNVVYPLKEHAAFDNEYRNVLNQIYVGSYDNCRYGFLILEAPPNSISVTPSRESLSMQGNTLATIKDLLTKFLANQNAAVAMGDSLIDGVFMQAIENKEFSFFFKHYNLRSEHISSALYPTRFGVTVEDLGKAIQRAKVKGVNFPINQRYINLLIKEGIINKKLNKLFRHSKNPVAALKRHVVYRLTKRMQDRMLKSRLTYMTDDLGDYAKPSTLATWREYNFLGYQTNTVVIAHNQNTYASRLPNISPFKELGNISHLLYTVPRSPARVKQAIDYFTKYGLKVVDMTIAHEGEDASIIEPEPKEQKPRKKRVAGIAKASSLYDSVTDKTIPYGHTEESAERIANPEWVVLYKNTQNNRNHYSTNNIHQIVFDGFMNAEITTTALRLFGSVGGIAVTSNQFDSYIDKGALPLRRYIQDKVLNQLKNNADFIKCLSRHIAMDGVENDVFKAITRDSILSKHYGVEQYIETPEVADWLNVLSMVKTWSRYGQLPADIQLACNDIPKDASYLVVKQKVESVDFDDQDFYNFKKIASSVIHNSSRADSARDIIINLVK